MIEQCKRCRKFLFDDKSCLCKPYKIFFEDWHGDEPYIVFGFSLEDVATKYAEYYNSTGDYALMNESIEIGIENPDGKKKRFHVGAEPPVRYWEKEIE